MQPTIVCPSYKKVTLEPPESIPIHKALSNTTVAPSPNIKNICANNLVILCLFYCPMAKKYSSLEKVLSSIRKLHLFKGICKPLLVYLFIFTSTIPIFLGFAYYNTSCSLANFLFLCDDSSSYAQIENSIMYMKRSLWKWIAMKYMHIVQTRLAFLNLYYNGYERTVSKFYNFLKKRQNSN